VNNINECGHLLLRLLLPLDLERLPIVVVLIVLVLSS
jgi:hypothetical protein